MSYYNCCGIRQSTVTFQKGWERGGGYYNLCGIRPKHSNISKGGREVELLQFVWY